MDVKAFRQLMHSTKQENLDVDRMISVQNIIQSIQRDGDAKLIEYSKQFDGQVIQQIDELKVSKERLKASWEELDPTLQESLILAKERIEQYEQSILYQDMVGDEISYLYHPIETAGFYIPGGKALYPSSVLMTIVPAIVAGVKNFVITTPVFEETSVTFAALYLCGIENNVFSIGGAQAIAALAYGTESIPKVDKICGPGNAYVAMAKRLVNGDVSIDAIAGPSEILLYVDDSIPVDAIVYDMFAQAEHDQEARTYLLCESQSFADTVASRIEALLPQQERKEIIASSLAINHFSIVDNRENLINVLNEIASEHVSIQHRDQDEIVEQIRYAGAVFKGYYSMEAIGDYVAGPSHVLPTAGTARFSHGLTANDFRTSNAVINITKESYEAIYEAGMDLANSEGLYCHKKSILIRKEENYNGKFI